MPFYDYFLSIFSNKRKFCIIIRIQLIIEQFFQSIIHVIFISRGYKISGMFPFHLILFITKNRACLFIYKSKDIMFINYNKNSIDMIKDRVIILNMRIESVD